MIKNDAQSKTGTQSQTILFNLYLNMLSLSHSIVNHKAKQLKV